MIFGIVKGEYFFVTKGDGRLFIMRSQRFIKIWRWLQCRVQLLFYELVLRTTLVCAFCLFRSSRPAIPNQHTPVAWSAP